jgi:DNA repair and recombination protein RAD52
MAGEGESTGGSRLFGRSEFNGEERETIRALLEQKLGKEHLSERPGAGGTKYTYVESWKAIQLANQIFGFNGWSSSVVDVTPDFIEENPGKFTVGVTAVVRVMLKDGTYHEDVGYGCAENPRKGTAIENAKKEAVTDARKRALRMFGNALGNCIYDKQHVKKFKSQATDQNGFVLEPPKVPLVPQHQHQHQLGPAPALPLAGIPAVMPPMPSVAAPQAPPPAAGKLITHSPPTHSPPGGPGAGTRTAVTSRPVNLNQHAGFAPYEEDGGDPALLEALAAMDQ